jgi:hypothetical protein
MKQMTADEFNEAIRVDPAWASRLTDPVEITNYFIIDLSNVTHLSPFLYFSGRDRNARTAYFAGCYRLKIAEGTFVGSVDFSDSRVEKIGKLKITGSDTRGNAATFEGCMLRLTQNPGHGVAKTKL